MRMLIIFAQTQLILLLPNFLVLFVLSLLKTKRTVLLGTLIGQFSFATILSALFSRSHDGNAPMSLVLYPVIMASLVLSARKIDKWAIQRETLAGKNLVVLSAVIAVVVSIVSFILAFGALAI